MKALELWRIYPINSQLRPFNYKIKVGYEIAKNLDFVSPLRRFTQNLSSIIAQFCFRAVCSLGIVSQVSKYGAKFKISFWPQSLKPK